MGLMEEDANSMLNWYPILEDIEKVNTPETVLVDAEKFPDDIRKIPGQRQIIGYDKEEVIEAIDEVGGYPVFIRTDHASYKHKLEQVSKIYSEDELERKIHDLANHNLNLGWHGVEYKALAIREWLDIEHEFKAFWGDIPIGYEIRVFIRDGNIACKHFYWVKDSIKRANEDNWEELWEETKLNTMEKWAEVKTQVKAVADEFDGAWSVDFAMTQDEKWYAIDMARFEDSYHPPSCENAPDVMEDLYGSNDNEEPFGELMEEET